MEPTETRAALTAFVAELHDEYEVWYAKAVRSTQRWNIGLQVLALLSSFAAAVVAAITEPTNLFWTKPALVLLPMAGGLATTVLTQAKLYDMWKLRENGRIEFQGLAQEGRRKLAAVSDPAELAKIHEDLQRRAQAIEVAQAGGFFGFFTPDTVLQFKQGDGAAQKVLSGQQDSTS
jgi:hypothetical protein